MAVEMIIDGMCFLNDSHLARCNAVLSDLPTVSCTERYCIKLDISLP